MKLQRFFVKNKAKVGEDLVIADPALSHQLGKVFRMKAGESVVLFDGDGFDYVSTIASLRKDGAVFHIEKSHPSIVSPKIALHVYPALIKKDKLEWVLQKATELGAASFHPAFISFFSRLCSFHLLFTHNSPFLMSIKTAISRRCAFALDG